MKTIIIILAVLLLILSVCFKFSEETSRHSEKFKVFMEKSDEIDEHIKKFLQYARKFNRAFKNNDIKMMKHWQEKCDEEYKITEKLNRELQKMKF